MENSPKSRFLSSSVRATAFAAFLTLCAACAHISVDSFQDPAVNFAPLQTWAWSPDAGKGPFDIDFSDPEYDAAIRKGISDGLANKGYRQVDATTADFMVSYHALRKDAQSSAPVNDTTDYSEGWFSQTDDQVSTTADSGGMWAEEYDKSELIVDIRRQSDNIMAWRGTATTDIVYLRPTAGQFERLKHTVDLVMDKFPPRPGQ